MYRYSTSLIYVALIISLSMGRTSAKFPTNICGWSKVLPNGETHYSFIQMIRGNNVKRSSRLRLYHSVWSNEHALMTCAWNSEAAVTENYLLLCQARTSEFTKLHDERFNIILMLASGGLCDAITSPAHQGRTGIRTARSVNHDLNGLSIQHFHGNGETSKGMRHRRMKRSFIVPGTLWCGSGNKAPSYADLGVFSDTDSCCREHDHCQNTILSFQSKYGIFNTNIFTISHCDCDNRFRSCLLIAKDSISNVVGYTFFNLLKMQCFEFTQKLQCVQRNWFGMCLASEMALYADVYPPALYNNTQTDHDFTETTIANYISIPVQDSSNTDFVTSTLEAESTTWTPSVPSTLEAESTTLTPSVPFTLEAESTTSTPSVPSTLEAKSTTLTSSVPSTLEAESTTFTSSVPLTLEAESTTLTPFVPFTLEAKSTNLTPSSAYAMTHSSAVDISTFGIAQKETLLVPMNSKEKKNEPGQGLPSLTHIDLSSLPNHDLHFRVQDTLNIHKQNDCEVYSDLDECSFRIPFQRQRYGLQNQEHRTVYHCDCTSRLFQALAQQKELNRVQTFLLEYVSYSCFTLQPQNCTQGTSCRAVLAKADLTKLLQSRDSDAEESRHLVGLRPNGRRPKLRRTKRKNRTVRLQKLCRRMTQSRTLQIKSVPPSRVPATLL